MTRARDVANLIGSGNYSSTTFTATAGQTAFTISHTQGFIQVFMNGLLLDETVDYTSNGSAVTLTSGAAAGDEIEVVAYNTFSVGDALNQAAADTRYVNATGDTITGNLGINVSPTAALDVRRSDADGKIAEFHQNGGYGFELSSSQTVARLRSGYLQAMSITTDAGSGAAEQMRISKEGYITTPNQPGFSAYRDAGHVTAGNVYIFDHTYYNVGNMYDSSNGRATVPVSGRYLVTVWLMSNNDAGYDNKYIRLRINQGNPAYKNIYSSTASAVHHQFSWSGVINLSANDYVDVYPDNMTVYGNDGKYSNFSMQLLS